MACWPGVASPLSPVSKSGPAKKKMHESGTVDAVSKVHSPAVEPAQQSNRAQSGCKKDQSHKTDLRAIAWEGQGADFAPWCHASYLASTRGSAGCPFALAASPISADARTAAREHDRDTFRQDVQMIKTARKYTTSARRQQYRAGRGNTQRTGSKRQYAHEPRTVGHQQRPYWAKNK